MTHAVAFLDGLIAIHSHAAADASGGIDLQRANMGNPSASDATALSGPARVKVVVASVMQPMAEYLRQRVAIATTESRSGLSVTAPIGVQLCVSRDQRAGLRSRACT
jgi:aminoglycoside/choline kinase family phosphotransferase